jgi:hypothetical protein
MFREIERVIVDWCEANSIPVEHQDGEWFAISNEDDFQASLTALANAVVGKIGTLTS